MDRPTELILVPYSLGREGAGMGAGDDDLGLLRRLRALDVLGHCWATLCASVPGFAPLAGERVVLVGGRDLEPAERERLSAAGIAHVGEREVGRLGPALGAAGSRVSLHLDLDVLDAETVGRANAYAMSGGIDSGELAAAVATVTGAAELAALTISAYDPAHDTGGGVRAALRETLAAVRS